MRGTDEPSDMRAFLRTARSLVGRDGEEPLSLDDIFFLGDCLRISGVVYLEKLEETRHVCVLLRLEKEEVLLYDPLQGSKRKPRRDVHLGLYARPVGLLRRAFLEEPLPNGNPWAALAARGRRLAAFLATREDFGGPASEWAASLPPLQPEVGSRDCAPLSLYVLSLCTGIRPARIPTRMAALEGLP